MRYSTNRAKGNENSQPFQLIFGDTHLAMVHNGNLTNAEMIRRHLIKKGVSFQSESDSEVIAQLVCQQPHLPLSESIKVALSQLQGAYALVFESGNQLIGVRDPHGIRPLCLGQTKAGDYVLASESCALDAIGATFLRNLAHGEMVIINDKGISSQQISDSPKPFAPCTFEYIYFARPDSIVDNIDVYLARVEAGRRLAQQKTLHPAVFGGILARRDDENHMQTIQDLDLGLIDMVAVNLYPFFEKMHEILSQKEMIEFIDIGGPSMLRASAKSFKDVIVLTDKKDYEANPVSILAFNQTLDAETVQHFSKIFLEIVIAPDFTEEALTLLNQKANLRVIRCTQKATDKMEMIQLDGGILCQRRDDQLLTELTQVTKKEVSEDQKADLLFALKVVKWVKSNAIVVVKNGQTLGIGGGEVSRIWVGKSLRTSEKIRIKRVNFSLRCLLPLL